MSPDDVDEEMVATVWTTLGDGPITDRQRATIRRIVAAVMTVQCQRRGRHASDIHRARCRADDAAKAAAYQSGQTLHDVAVMFGCGVSSVARALQRQGVVARKQGPQRRETGGQVTKSS